MDFLSTLNPAQQDAVLHTDGPLLILAGAGSGKTRVITYRMAHLIGNGFARPDEVLHCVVARSGQEPVVVNLDIAPAERSDEVWFDAGHPRP